MNDTDTARRLRELVEQWRAMAKSAFAEGPIPHDEAGHAGRWTAVEMCADELDALVRESEVAARADVEPAEKCDHKFIDSNHCLKCGWIPQPLPSVVTLLESILADKSAYQWHTAIRNTLSLRAGASVPASPPQWLPIESAPRDGSRILLHPGSSAYSTVGRRSLTHSLWESLPGKYSIQPTHWMPLPEPPAAALAGVPPPQPEKEKVKHKLSCASRLVWNSDFDPETNELRKDHQPLLCNCGAVASHHTPKEPK